MAVSITVVGPIEPQYDPLFTPAALAFLETLHRRFNQKRRDLLQRRQDIQQQLDRGLALDFLPETEEIRHGAWQVDPIPPDLLDRRVEITGPTDPKMVINALNSGARVFMADFEDALSPSWNNLLEGQTTLSQAVKGTLEHQAPNGKRYRLKERRAVLVVRPRGWHLDEVHVRVDGEPMAGALFDFGLYVFHNSRELLARNTAPYFYLPKLESYAEAALWNAVFDAAEEQLSMSNGTIKATVLIETIMAALQMEEILYVLRRHVVGLNAGRWDYLFSVIKKFRAHSNAILPDRNQITMTVPFMRAYTNLLVNTCHRRGAHAIGGMAAFIPSRRDPDVNREALARVQEDKEREARDGFDGTWVAHPDLVPVAQAAFDAVLGTALHQQKNRRDDVRVTAADLLTFAVPNGTVTEAGIKNNLAVSVQYLAEWLNGHGAVGLYHLMEDAATAEIARAQLYQWQRHRVDLADGTAISPERLDQWLADVVSTLPPHPFLEEAQGLVRQCALEEPFVDFITIPAYGKLVADSQVLNSHALEE